MLECSHRWVDNPAFIEANKSPQFVESIESRRPIINPRPLALLQALASSDLTLIQAADHLCMSHRAANKHVEAIKKALEAETLLGALYKAIKLGLVQ